MVQVLLIKMKPKNFGKLTLLKLIPKHYLMQLILIRVVKYQKMNGWLFGK